METWRDVVGYEGLYQVSDTGRVRSIDRMTTGNRNRLIKGKVLRQWSNGFGYLIVALSKNGADKTLRVHRLVAQAFIDNPSEKPYINHKDGNPKNNRVDNLEWCTQAENVKHAYDTGLHKYRGTLTREQVEYILTSYTPYRHSARKIARELGVNESTVYGVLHGRQKYLRGESI